MSEQSNQNVYGPALPPHMKTPSTPDKSPIGPALPPHLIKPLTPPEPESTTPEESSPPPPQIIGPKIPSHLRQKLQEEAEDCPEEEEIYGPLPVGSGLSTAAQVALEERALQMKIDSLSGANDGKEATREEWMLELPAAKAGHFGLGPRSFRRKEAPDLTDRSSWTDTPNKNKEQEDKIDVKEEARLKNVKRRDKQQEEMAKKSKRASESLMDIHTKKLKKEKNEEKDPIERKPFSRETDLQVNRFDEAQKKAVLKKAQLLDTRFSSGESKYL